jgi:hypothetical protein
VLAGDRHDLRVERGNFHRQHLDVGRLECREILFQPLPRLVLAEEGLAQKVQVHPQPLEPAGREVLVQKFRLGG